jgi:fatty-acyl-CoA synthase
VLIREKIKEYVNKNNFTLGYLLDLNAEFFFDDEAVIINRYRKTWGEFHKDIMKFTCVLHHLGFEKGDKIALWSQNRYEWMVAWFASLKLGIISVPMDHWYRPEESKYILNHSDSVGVICTSDYLEQIDMDRCEYYPNLKKIILMDDPHDKYRYKNGIYSMKELVNYENNYNLEKVNKIQDSLDRFDTAFFLYTSGTTGIPKGAQLSHYSIIKNMIFTSEIMKNTHADKMVIPVPFSHIFGNVVGITLACITGTAMIPLRDQDPKVALETVRRERATILHGTPTHFIRYIREKEQHPEWEISCLRTGIIAGAPCPPETMKGIIEVLKIPEIVIGYGMTELSPFCTMTSPEDSFYYRTNSVGKSLPEMEIKIVDEQNNSVEIGEKGEICVKGYNVMKGYYKSPEKTRDAIDQEGFMHTGDLGVVDKNGYYKIVGRKKDMIIYGGFNIYPVMIEDYLLNHPNILEVAVVGVPDPEYGEVVAAVVKVNDGITEQNLVDYCYGNISSPSVPRFVLFGVELPLSGRGKVQKFRLKEILAKMLDIY